MTGVERTITGYHQDADGEWVAELACGHGHHLRHRPPFQERAWATTAGGRAERLGTTMRCRVCDQEGGEAPCLTAVLCPECGAVLDEMGHRPGCGVASDR